MTAAPQRRGVLIAPIAWRYAPAEAEAWRLNADGSAEWLQRAGRTWASLGKAPAFGRTAAGIVLRYV